MKRRAALWCLGVSLWATSTVAADQPLRLAVERDYPPFVFVDEQGRARGLSLDILQDVAGAAGLQIEPLAAEPLAALLERLQRGEADLITSLRPTPDRARYLAFTRPYVEVPAILVTRADAPEAVSRRGLAALGGQRVAVGEGYAVEQPMREAYPSVVWHTVKDDTVALQALERGEHAAAVLDAASAAWIIQRYGLSSLRSAGRVGFSYPLSFGVRRDRTDVVEALDRAVLALPAARRQQILDRWLGPLPVGAIAAQPRWPLVGGAAALVVALALAGWAWRRSRHG